MIAQQFSRAAKTYDQYATTQKQTADLLLKKLTASFFFQQIIKRSLSDSQFTTPWQIIDLGCGTGYLTQKISKLLPNTQIKGIDFAGGMLKEANKKQQTKINFQQKSIESELQTTSQYHLIFSNATLHWLDDLAGFFSQLKHKLIQEKNYRGKAFFSLYVAGSLPELQQLFQNFIAKETKLSEQKTPQAPLTTNNPLSIPYPSISTIRHYLKKENYHILFFSKRAFQVKYPSFKNFHYQQHQLGTFKPAKFTGSHSTTTIPSNSYRFLKKNYKSLLQLKPFSCTYQILFLGIENKD